MGAKLLDTPDLLVSILEALVSNMPIPVTCKIRLLNPTESETSMDRTISLLKRIEATKVKAIGIHCRFPPQRPREKAHWHFFETLTNHVSIPVIANGDLFSLEDAKTLKLGFGKGLL